MKPKFASLANRSILVGSIFLAASPLVQAGQTWTATTTTNSNVAASWGGALPSATSGPLLFGTAGTTVSWNGISAVNSVNIRGITFNSGGNAFTFNTVVAGAGPGTYNIQFTGVTGAPSETTNYNAILNSSSNLQTINPLASVFFQTVKTIDGGTTGLALNGGIDIRSDSMTGTQTNTVNLIGASLNSTTAFITQTGTFTGTIKNAVTKNGTGKWTVAGTSTYTGVTTLTAGTLQFAKKASLYNGTTSSWTAANLKVAGTLALNVGGTNEFATTDVTTLLNNLGGANGGTAGGFAANSSIGFDTTNASGGAFTVANTLANSSGTGGGAIGVAKFGTGSLTLSVANSYTGATAITGGTLIAGNVGAFGTTSAISLSNGITGGNLQLSTDTSVNAYAITGSSGVGPGTIVSDRATSGAGITHVLGAAVLGSNTFNFTKGINVASGTAAISLASLNLAAGVAGTVILNPTSANLQILGAVNIGGSASAKTLQLDGTSTGSSISGDISNNLATLSLTKAGSGTWGLSGTNTYTGNTTVTGGTLNLTGTLTGNTTTSTLALGTTAANTVVNVSNNMTQFAVTGANFAGSNVAYNQTAGTVNVSSALTMVNAAATTGSGAFNLTGGTLNVNTTGNFLVINDASGSGSAYVGGTGTLNIVNVATNGGVAFAGNGVMTVGPGGTVTRANGGGAFYLTAFANATGTLNVAGGNIDLGTNLFRHGNGAAIAGINGFVNLASGTLTMGADVSNSAIGANLYANFAGGTLKASGTLASPFSTGGGVTTVSTLFGAIDNTAALGNSTQNFVGGLTVDTNNNSVTYGNTLLGATGNGVKQSNITVTGGTGYIGAPVVTFTGGTLATNGTPASGYAVISGGAVTGIVITSPGEYTVDPTAVTLTGGGFTTQASVALSALSSNPADTGLTKIGLGTLTLPGNNTYAGATSVTDGTLSLSGTNTYAGATSITGGTLTLSGTGSINNTSGITINGSGAKFVQNSTVAGISGITLTQGTLTGSGTVGNVTVGAGTGGVISNNGGVAGASLTTGNLTFNGAATVNLFSDGISTAPLLAAGALSTHGAGIVTVNASATVWSNGTTYDLISYTGGSIGGAGFDQFSLVGNVSGLNTVRGQTATFASTGSAITMTIAGFDAIWTGALSSEWSTNILGAPKNWTLTGGGGDTDFQTADATVFGNSGALAVDISNGNVSPSKVTFTNTTGNDYVLTGANGITGLTALNKTGTGTLTINNTNTFTGGTNITDGTLVLGNVMDTLADTGAVTVNGATAVLSIGTNSDTVGAVSLKNGASITGSTGTLSGSSYAVENGSISAILGGAGALAKTTAGTVTLSGVNTFSGGAAINAGTVQLSGSGTLGAAGASVSVSSGALLDLNGTSQNIKFTAGTGVGTVANNSGSGTSTLTLAAGTASAGLFTIVDNTNASAGKVAVVITANIATPSNLNTYSGGTTVNGGAYIYVNGATPLGAGTGTITLTAPGTGKAAQTGSGLLVDGATYANDITGAGYVHNNANNGATVVTTTLTGNINTSGAFIFRAGTGIVYNFAGNGTTSDLSGVIGSTTDQVNGAVATGSVIKSGTGTLTLSGANIYTGSTTVQAGTLILSGARTAASGAIIVGNLAGSTGTLNIQNGTYALGTNSFNVGSGDTAVGVVNQSGGTVSFTGGNRLLIGNAGNSTGTYNLSGGTLSPGGGNGVRLGVNTGTGNPTSTFSLSGTGVLDASTTTVQIGRSDSANVSNTINFFTQTGTLSTATIGTFTMGGGAANAATAANIAATLDLSAGSFTATNFTSLSAADANTSTIIIRGTALVTLGNLPTVRGIGSTATLYLNGGTLKNSATGTFISGLDNAFIKAGGATFDTSLNSTTISQDLLTDAVSTSGGLIKLGANTLTLTGANTYTGATTVSVGTLALVGGSQKSAVTVSSGASLGFTLGSPTTSTASVDLTTGTVKITGTAMLSSYTLMTASGFTGTPVLDSPIAGYSLVVQGASLKLATPYGAWQAGPFANAFTDTDPSHDPDGDGLTNLEEFAFGIDPTTSSNGTIAYDNNGVLTSHGPPVLLEEAGIFYAVYGRRVNYATAGPTYTTRFSPDLSVFSNTAGGPTTVIATDGVIEAVKVPYPSSPILTDSGPLKARFFQVGVQ